MFTLSEDTKNLVEAIQLCQRARLEAHGFKEAWLYCRHAEAHLQKQLSALLRAAEEAC